MMIKIIISIGTIIVIPLILHVFKWDNWQTSILSAILIAFIEQLIFLVKECNDIKLQLKSNIEVTQNKDNVNKILLLISNNIMKLSVDGKKENNIFINFYIDKLQTMADKIDRSFQLGKFEIDYNMDKEDYTQLSKSIFKVFNGSNDDYFFTISRSNKSSIEWFFDLNKMSNTYLKMAYSYLKEEKIKEVRRLFVYEEFEDLNNKLLNLLLQLHKNSEFKIKIISIDTFMAHFKKEHLSDDFGIYGKHFIFENNLNGLNGEELFCGFNINSNRIDEYRECFELVWNISYEIQFNDSISKVKKDNEIIFFPLEKFESDLQNMNFNDIDKIQAVIYDDFNICRN